MDAIIPSLTSRYAFSKSNAHQNSNIIIIDFVSLQQDIPFELAL